VSGRGEKRQFERKADETVKTATVHVAFGRLSDPKMGDPGYMCRSQEKRTPEVKRKPPKTTFASKLGPYLSATLSKLPFISASQDRLRVNCSFSFVLL